ncbi:unnamed protein product [Chondrus crispus]|uniref:Uncharacterized protein n=1 Tax=Chondrus crispus TaxID=2769 RepID=R7QAJ0_CHOCR|nr:unnamed protein product [Chondrus crispus]CDF35512.1 unnamed protein product [Chondrus crispus]|eukprot:XP_005715331.1 unnamed protein product [Chondrus crispus]
METSPEALLKVFLERPTFIPSLVNLLHIGSVPQLLNCLIPDRCVDDLASMDPRTVSFEAPMTLALTVLAGGAVLHHLANAFVEAAQTIYTAATLPLDDGTVDSGQVHRAEQIAFNIVHVYGMVILKSIRAVRLKPDCRACGYLNVFGNANSASTIAGCLQAGIDLFMETHGEESSILKYALELTINLLQCLDKDKERRVASVYGQPQMLETRALEAELDPLLQPLVGVLIDTVETGRGHGQIRIRILEFFVECQSVCSERLVDSFNKARIGEIAMTVMLMNPHNSIMQKIVSRAVESALVTKHRTGGYAHHWLVKSRLIEKIMSTWRRDSGDKAWKDTGLAQKKPYLSALLHMGCCVQHWMAIQREVEEYVPDRNENGGEKAGADPVRKVLVDEVVLEFEEFFKNSMDGIMRMESGHLGGAPPRRRGSRAGGNSFGRSFGSFGTTSASVLRRSGSGMGGTGKGQNRAHLVRSPSAHRFGYVAPVNTVRSELDDMFIEDDLTEGGTFGTTDVGTCFSSMFDVESENSF